MTNRFEKYANSGPKGSELEAVERGIDETMRALVGDHARRRVSGPSSMLGPSEPKPKTANEGREVPIAPYGGLHHIDRMLGATPEEMDRLHPKPKA